MLTNSKVGVQKPCIENDNSPMSKKINEVRIVRGHNRLNIQQKEVIGNYTYNASEFYMIDHTLMEKYSNELEPGNVVVVDCSLERCCETNWTKYDKVAFKICGISYIGNGPPPLNKLAMLGSCNNCAPQTE